jgi:flagellar biogenesis protein FliO
MAVRLLGVFALLAAVLWVLKRTGGVGARRRGTPLQVLSTTRLGKTATLSVVRVHDEEYVLGVTGSTVTVVSSRPAPAADAAPTPAPAAVPDPEPETALDELLVETPPRPVGPPSTARFLRDGWEVLRKRPVEATSVSSAALAAALAHARGEDAPPAPPVPLPLPADGPADDQAGTDAGPGEGYDLWSRTDVAV